MILVIDNYDSFVYNLVQYIGELGQEVRVFRNDGISLNKIRELSPSSIFISPGPATPKQAGISVEVVSRFAGEIPLFGVCLGHQSIAEAFGGNIIRADQILHGKTSEIHHDGRSIFTGIQSPLTATRYHSLIVEKKSLPKVLEISAWTEDGTIMGIRHIEFECEGVQFHPESILTAAGKQILQNFVNRSLKRKL